MEPQPSCPASATAAGRAIDATADDLVDIEPVAALALAAPDGGGAAEVWTSEDAAHAMQLAETAGHDVRNALAAIGLGAELLSRATEGGAAHTAVLGHIDSATERAQRGLLRLLALTRACIGRRAAQPPRSIALHALVGQSIVAMSGDFEGRAVEHDRLGEGDCVADAETLDTVVRELVTGAAARTSPERPVLVASIIEPRHFSIAVHSERTTDANISEGGGNGDCFIVNEIVRAHGGDLTVRVEVGRGTSMVARFPRESVGAA